jgi:glycosyltransferase involved in cell wall biosynthesis
VVVVVGGGGPALPQYRALAQQAGVADRLRFVGPLTAMEVEAHFRAAELFCLASTVRAEAYGVAVAEAMARGLPVVATRIPGSGLNWLHQEGVTGLAVPVNDPPALAGAIRCLLDDAELRRRCAQAARARWVGHLTAQTMCDRTLELYQRLLAQQPSSPPLRHPPPDTETRRT